MLLTLNRDQLARHVGFALPTLDAMIKRWPEFPVLARGGLGKAWKFDAAEVVAFLQGKRDEEDAAQAEKDELLAQLTLPIIRRDEKGNEISLDDRVKAAKLRSLEREEAKEMRFLVATDEVRTALERALRRYGQAEASAIDRVVRAHNLPEAVKRALEREFAEARTAFVRDAGEFLTQPQEEENFALTG